VVGSEWPWNGDGGGGQPAAPLGLLTQARTCISPLYSQVQQSKRARYWTVKLHLDIYGVCSYNMDFGALRMF
jgi:hypothetical protein